MVGADIALRGTVLLNPQNDTPEAELAPPEKPNFFCLLTASFH